MSILQPDRPASKPGPDTVHAVLALLANLGLAVWRRPDGLLMVAAEPEAGGGGE